MWQPATSTGGSASALSASSTATRCVEFAGARIHESTAQSNVVKISSRGGSARR